jgi:hypothetical protein
VKQSCFFESTKILIKHIAKLIKWKRRPKIMKSEIEKGNIKNNNNVP